MYAYYYVNAAGQQVGPLLKEQLLSMSLPPTTLIWREGLATWTELRQVAELVSPTPPPYCNNPYSQGGANAHVAAAAAQSSVSSASSFTGTAQSTTGVASSSAGSVPPYGANGGYGFSPSNNGAPPYHMKPSSYLVWSILCIVLGCIPLGIVSLIYATKVDHYWLTQRYKEAYGASSKAKNWALVGLLLAVLQIVVAGLWSFRWFFEPSVYDLCPY